MFATMLHALRNFLTVATARPFRVTRTSRSTAAESGTSPTIASSPPVALKPMTTWTAGKAPGIGKRNTRSGRELTSLLNGGCGPKDGSL